MVSVKGLLRVIYEELWEQYHSGGDGRSALVTAVARWGDLDKIPDHVVRVHAGAPHDDCECQGIPVIESEGDR